MKAPQYMSYLSLFGPKGSGKTHLVNRLRERGFVLIEINEDEPRMEPQEQYGLPETDADTLARHIDRLGHNALCPPNRPRVVEVKFTHVYRPARTKA
jgi:predicted ATPase